MEHCSCPECISACRNDAGRLVPAELEPLATFLNVTVKELVCGYLVKKPYTWKTATVYVPAPAKLKGNSFLAEPGSIIPDYYEKQSGLLHFSRRKRALLSSRGQTVRMRRLHGLQKHFSRQTVQNPLRRRLLYPEMEKLQLAKIRQLTTVSACFQ